MTLATVVTEATQRLLKRDDSRHPEIDHDFTRDAGQSFHDLLESIDLVTWSDDAILAVMRVLAEHATGDEAEKIATWARFELGWIDLAAIREACRAQDETNATRKFIDTAEPDDLRTLLAAVDRVRGGKEAA